MQLFGDWRYGLLLDKDYINNLSGTCQVTDEGLGCQYYASLAWRDGCEGATGGAGEWVDVVSGVSRR